MIFTFTLNILFYKFEAVKTKPKNERKMHTNKMVKEMKIIYISACF